MPKHHCYVEPFAGSGQVLTQKTKSRVEIYNDIDADLINFLMVLRTRKNDLIEALQKIPTSRFLAEMWKKEELPSEPLEKAVRWYYLLRHLMIPANNENFTSGFRSGKIKSVAVDYQNAIMRLDKFEERLRTVNFEMLDYEDCIKRFDSDKSFFYVDPPYIGRESLYRGGFDINHHINLANVLRNVKGKVMLSYYGDTIIEQMYGDWRIVKVDSIVQNGVVKKELNQTKKVETEWIIMNYDEEGNKLQLENKLFVYENNHQEQMTLF